MSTDTSELLNKLLAELDNEASCPDFLYHYTTPAGLLGILGSKSIRLTHSGFLNDAKEFLHTHEFFMNRLNRIINRGGPFEEDDPKKDLANHLLKVNLTRVLPFFSFSLSKNEDQLSQWRAYTGSTGGYCIGFRSAWLKEFAFECNLSLVRVSYDQSIVKNIFKVLFNRCYEFWSTQEKDSADSTFLGVMCRIAQQCKHPAFREEDEWRLLYDRAALPQRGEVVRHRGAYLTPYVEVGFSGEESGEKTAMPSLAVDGQLLDLWVGPGLDHNRAKIGIETLMAEYKGIWSIRYSSAPYRTD